MRRCAPRLHGQPQRERAMSALGIAEDRCRRRSIFIAVAVEPPVGRIVQHRAHQIEAVVRSAVGQQVGLGKLRRALAAAPVVGRDDQKAASGDHVRQHEPGVREAEGARRRAGGVAEDHHAVPSLEVALHVRHGDQPGKGCRAFAVGRFGDVGDALRDDAVAGPRVAQIAPCAAGDLVDQHFRRDPRSTRIDGVEQRILHVAPEQSVHFGARQVVRGEDAEHGARGRCGGCELEGRLELARAVFDFHSQGLRSVCFEFATEVVVYRLQAVATEIDQRAAQRHGVRLALARIVESGLRRTEVNHVQFAHTRRDGNPRARHCIQERDRARPDGRVQLRDFQHRLAPGCRQAAGRRRDGNRERQAGTFLVGIDRHHGDARLAFLPRRVGGDDERTVRHGSSRDLRAVRVRKERQPFALEVPGKRHRHRIARRNQFLGWNRPRHHRRRGRAANQRRQSGAQQPSSAVQCVRAGAARWSAHNASHDSRWRHDSASPGAPVRRAAPKLAF